MYNTKKRTGLYTLDELAEKSGISVALILNYQQAGLLPRPKRAHQTWLYNTADYRLLKVIYYYSEAELLPVASIKRRLFHQNQIVSLHAMALCAEQLPVPTDPIHALSSGKDAAYYHEYIQTLLQAGYQKAYICLPASSPSIPIAKTVAAYYKDYINITILNTGTTGAGHYLKVSTIASLIEKEVPEPEIIRKLMQDYPYTIMLTDSLASRFRKSDPSQHHALITYTGDTYRLQGYYPAQPDAIQALYAYIKQEETRRSGRLTQILITHARQYTTSLRIKTVLADAYHLPIRVMASPDDSSSSDDAFICVSIL